MGALDQIELDPAVRAVVITGAGRAFAKALDRLQPLFLNTLTGGGTWTENGVTEQQVMEQYGPTIEAGSPLLWQEASRLVRQHFAGRASEVAL